jgi:hypothetical protein
MRPTKWWQPDAPEKALSGVLFEDPDEGWLLELDGNFADMDLNAMTAQGITIAAPVRRLERFPVIVGLSQGRMVSLMNCEPLSFGLFFTRASGSLKLRPTTIIHGVYFESVEDFQLRSLAVSYKHLDTWIATSGFKFTFDTNVYPLKIQYTKPEPIECELSEGIRLSIDFSASGPKLPVTTSLHMTQQSWLKISSVVPTACEQLFTHLHGFANLIAVMVGKPLTPLAISGTCLATDDSGKTSDVGIEIVENRKPIADASSEEVQLRDVPFTPPDLRSRFNEIMQAWFARDSKLQSLYDLYFSGLHGPARYVETRFLNIFQALESYHRRSVPPDIQKQAAYDEHVRRILALLGDGKDKKWLKKRLTRDQEPTAEERLRGLITSFKADWLLTESDAALATNLRNYYVHFDPKYENKIPDQTARYRIMINLTTKMRALCEVILLSAIGLSEDEVQDKLKKCRRVERNLVSEVV